MIQFETPLHNFICPKFDDNLGIKIVSDEFYLVLMDLYGFIHYSSENVLL